MPGVVVVSTASSSSSSLWRSNHPPPSVVGLNLHKKSSNINYPFLPKLPLTLSTTNRTPMLQVKAAAAAKKQTFSSLDELLQLSDKPVLVDFYATWCGPCQFMAPVLNQVSLTLADTIQVVKIDTEKYPQIADKYNIAALPTFILFKDGKPFDRFEGALPADQLIQRIQATLSKKI